MEAVTDDIDKLVATECRCGNEIHHCPDDDAPACAMCGEPYCDACDYWVDAGIYGHRDCVIVDGRDRARWRQRIDGRIVGAPIAKLKLVWALVDAICPMPASERAWSTESDEGTS